MPRRLPPPLIPTSRAKLAPIRRLGNRTTFQDYRADSDIASTAGWVLCRRS